MGLPLAHGLDKVSKEIVSVVRAGAGFGVILHREDWQLPVANTGYRLIIEIEVSNLDLRFINGAGVEGKAVVLAGDFDLLGEAAGLVEAAMTELKLKGFSAQGKS